MIFCGILKEYHILRKLSKILCSLDVKQNLFLFFILLTNIFKREVFIARDLPLAKVFFFSSEFRRQGKGISIIMERWSH